MAVRHTLSYVLFAIAALLVLMGVIGVLARTGPTLAIAGVAFALVAVVFYRRGK